MTDPITITNDLLEPGMDYTRLRNEGQQLITKLAGQVWTDYNLTDPGITLLESLCYAITDLSYRLGFDMQDLLAANPDSNSIGKQFFSAKEILPVNPLTVTDYRKLLIDIKGVKNAWLEKAESSETPVVYNPETVSLSFPCTPTEASQLRKLNGLYRVLLELDGSEERYIVIEQVKKRLHQFRNVGEDFSEVRVLSDDEITIKAGIEIHHDADVNEILANAYIALNNYMSPLLTFYSLDERLDAGHRVEDIFKGPILDHGFMDDDELSRFQRRTEIHTTDIVTLLLDVDGITAVNKVHLSHGRQSPVDWILKVSDPANTKPELKPLVQFLDDNDITLSTHEGTTMALPNKDIVLKKVEASQVQEKKITKSSIKYQDLIPPVGRYRNLTEFVSVQNELPGNYGVGRHGLSGSSSEPRQAQAKQLQAYLMVFDQLLVNYLAQMANARELFAVQPDRGIATAESPEPTYFTTKLSSEVAGVEDIINGYSSDYSSRLASIVTDPDIDTNRMNRLLNHLLARHGQDFTSAATLYPPTEDNSNISEQISAHIKVIPAKQRFLQDYADLSQNRAKGFDYTDVNTTGTDNVEGLKKRISRLLDIQDFSLRSFASSKNHSDQAAEGFHLIDHILLRPDLPTGHITFIDNGKSGTVLCKGKQEHGLQDNDKINFTQSTYGYYLAASYSIKVFDDYSFHISDDYETPSDPQVPETGNWVSELQKRDKVISFLSEIDQIKQGTRNLDDTHHKTCLIIPELHGLGEGDVVIITGAGVPELNGIHRVFNIKQTGFEIDVPFQSTFTAESQNTSWYRYPVYADPYSCQISFIFPAAIGRFRNSAGGQQIRDLVAEVVKKETPAHITPYLFWFEDSVLQQFEVDYQAWLTAKAAPQSNSQKIDTTIKANKLLEWLVQHGAKEASEVIDVEVPDVESPEQEDPIEELLQDDTPDIGVGPVVENPAQEDTVEELLQDDTPSVGVGPVVESPVQENPIEELLQDGAPGSGGTPTVGGAPGEGATDEEETNQEKPAEKILEGDTPDPGEMPTADESDGKGIAEDGLI